MADLRVEALARLLVERSLGVQPGWQVLVRATPLARPLVDEIVRLVARRGAYALIRLSFSVGPDPVWAAEAPEELVRELPGIARFEAERIDALVSIDAPENTRDPAVLPPARRALYQEASRPLRQRVMTHAIPWVVCDFPTHALAQDAGMALGELEDFFYGACLVDWDEIAVRLQRIAERLDRAAEVRIVGAGTDLRLSVAGRTTIFSAGYRNMPDGEVFTAPIEDSVEGVVEFGEFTASYWGNEVEGARLVFREGRVVEATARAGEEFLLATLDADEGARRLGELGIGCNPGIQRYTKNVGFDEKMDGTVHLALGESYAATGGVNVSRIHWDLVKDLRNGGQLWLDGELVQESGRWLI